MQTSCCRNRRRIHSPERIIPSCFHLSAPLPLAYCQRPSWPAVPCCAVRTN